MNRPLMQLRFISSTATLRGEQTVVGRSGYCSLLLADPSVSRVHAAIDRGDENVEIRDLGSKNGTFVNGHRVGREPVRLQLDDVVRFGDVSAVVEESAPSSARSDSTDRPSASDVDLTETASLPLLATTPENDDG